jgi:hypothetical protein
MLSFVQQEIIDKGKTVLLATPFDIIMNKFAKGSLALSEVELLLAKGYIPVKTPLGDAQVAAPY